MASFLKSKAKEELPETATGVKQTIQARHGTATFVPKGYTIKIINTYGRQVVDTWAFALHKPPTQQEWDEDNKEDVEDKTKLKQAEENDAETKPEKSRKSSKSDVNGSDSMVVVEEEPKTPEEQKAQEDQEEIVSGEGKADDEAKGDTAPQTDVKEEQRPAEDNIKAENAEDTVQSASTSENKEVQPTDAEPNKGETSADAKSKNWSSYLPSIRRGKQPTTTESKTEPKAEEAQSKDDGKGSPTTNKGWGSYIPSIRRGKATEASADDKNKDQRTWGSYIPSGQGFSTYIKSSDAISSFASMHQRDPTKSVAEQIYDFSKTPVGAAGISVASGSGYASSIYAAYTAYSTVNAKKAQNQPGMEFLSMSHTRVSARHLSPKVGDVLVTNLRAPLLTLIEDHSPGSHDTLMAACDPIRYRELGVKDWAEHGSCAQNLVLALQEMNKQVGLKGQKAIGGDVTVNSVPTPLNLFMNVTRNEDGEIGFGSPKGSRGDYVRFRAERDVVIVMSACPQDVTDINGKKPMVAHFVVQDSSDEDKKIADQRAKEAQAIIEKARLRTEAEKQQRSQSFRQGSSSTNRPSPIPIRRPSGQRAPPKKLERRASSRSASTISVPRKESQMVDSPPLKPKQPPPAPGRNKPRKLERRSSTPRGP